MRKKNFIQGPVESNTSKKYRCHRCEKTYLHQASLHRHLYWECGKEPQFKCFYCPYRCKQKAQWVRHIRLRHNDHYNSMEDYFLNYSLKNI